MNLVQNAITQLSSERNKLDGAIAALKQLDSFATVNHVGRPRKADATAAVPRKKRRMSAAGRKRISEAAKARWRLVKAKGKRSLRKVA